MPERDIGNAESNSEVGGDGLPIPPGKQWLFGIGIGKYVELPNLANAVKDVKDIIKVLTEDYGISPTNTVTLFDEEANQENVIHELDQLAGKVGKDDNLLIYFAGHGYLNKTTDMGYWIPHDAKKGKTSRYIGNSTIRDYLKAINSKHTLLITDSCFSGSLFVRGANRSSAALHELESIPSRWAICSGRSDEEVSDGVPGQNSPFAQSILDALSDNTSQLLNVAKVADRVVEQTRSNHEQLPEGNPIQGVGHKGGQYIFHRKAREEKFWEDCQREDGIQLYSQYLGQFPGGKYRSVALARLKELEDEEAWELAKKLDTISALHIYIGRDPDGKYIEEARDRISILEERGKDSATDERLIVHGKDSIPRPQKRQSPKNQAKKTSSELKNSGKRREDDSKAIGRNQIITQVDLEADLAVLGMILPIIVYTLSALSGSTNNELINYFLLPGFIVHLVYGIVFSNRCASIHFKLGVHWGYLIPLLSFISFFVVANALIIVNINWDSIVFITASVFAVVISILCYRYVLSALGRWCSSPPQ